MHIKKNENSVKNVKHKNQNVSKFILPNPHQLIPESLTLCT